VQGPALKGKVNARDTFKTAVDGSKEGDRVVDSSNCSKQRDEDASRPTIKKSDESLPAQEKQSSTFVKDTIHTEADEQTLSVKGRVRIIQS